MHTIFALLCFVVVIHWLIFPYPSGLLHWHCGNLTIAPVPAKQPWWIWINTSFEFIMNNCITTTKQSTTKPCAYFLGYTVGYSYKMDGFVLCMLWYININSFLLLPSREKCHKQEQKAHLFACMQEFGINAIKNIECMSFIWKQMTLRNITHRILGTFVSI